MPKFNDFIKDFGEQGQPTPKKQYGGIAGDLQKAGFEPYEVNEKEDYLKVKNNEGKDFEIRNSGKGYNYNVFEDGKQTYQYVPNYKYFENIVGGKNIGEFEKYRVKEEPKEEPNSQEYEGYRLERTPDGKWVNRDTYEYFDSKVEAQKDIDKFISSQRQNKPKPTGTQKLSELKDYVGKLSDDEKEMLLDLLNSPKKK